MKYILTPIIIVCSYMSTGAWCPYNGGLQDREYISPLGYVVVTDKLSIDIKEPAYNHRDMEVLLDRKTFSERTLKQLYALISRRFPIPYNLTVMVYTNPEQVDTSDERGIGKVIFEGPSGSGKPTPEELIFRKYPYAILIRQDGNELFRYNLGFRNSKLKTIVLKGKDPMP